MPRASNFPSKIVTVTQSTENSRSKLHPCRFPWSLPAHSIYCFSTKLQKKLSPPPSHFTWCPSPTTNLRLLGLKSPVALRHGLWATLLWPCPCLTLMSHPASIPPHPHRGARCPGLGLPGKAGVESSHIFSISWFFLTEKSLCGKERLSLNHLISCEFLCCTNKWFWQKNFFQLSSLAIPGCIRGTGAALEAVSWWALLHLVLIYITERYWTKQTALPMGEAKPEGGLQLLMAFQSRRR